jgi:hypothetical protein
VSRKSLKVFGFCFILLFYISCATFIPDYKIYSLKSPETRKIFSVELKSSSRNTYSDTEDELRLNLSLKNNSDEYINLHIFTSLAGTPSMAVYDEEGNKHVKFLAKDILLRSDCSPGQEITLSYYFVIPKTVKIVYFTFFDYPKLYLR